MAKAKRGRSAATKVDEVDQDKMPDVEAEAPIPTANEEKPANGTKATQKKATKASAKAVKDVNEPDLPKAQKKETKKATKAPKAEDVEEAAPKAEKKVTKKAAKPSKAEEAPKPEKKETKKSAGKKETAEKEEAPEMEESAPKPAKKAKVAEPVAARGVKRSRATEAVATKRARIDETRFALRGPHLKEVEAVGGVVLTVGTGDTGQLGHGPDVMDLSKPKVVAELNNSPIIAISAGGMHTLCLTKDGCVYSFGCNDDAALGRHTEDDDETYTPAKVSIEGKVVQISAGDSHSVALTEDGRTFYWGTFRDNSGPFGLTPDGSNQPKPIALAHHLKVKKIVSGENHIALLTEDGQIYTLGCAEQGRLGRIGEPFSNRGGRRGLVLPLTADKVHARNVKVTFVDVWAGSMSTVALTTDNEVLVCGLNNYGQLGLGGKKTIIYTMTSSPAFTAIAKENGLAQVSFGQHHVLLLDGAGKVYAIGRHDYGVLGLGEEIKTEVTVPTVVFTNDVKCVEIGCGTSVSFSVSVSGEAFSWGMGTNYQLAIDNEDNDAHVPTRMVGKQLAERKVFGVSGGGQHTVLLAKA